VVGAADTLTGEQLGPDSLCIAVETNDDRKLNANSMKSLRGNARKFFNLIYVLKYLFAFYEICDSLSESNPQLHES
jgi:hypothetical protein